MLRASTPLTMRRSADPVPPRLGMSAVLQATSASERVSACSRRSSRGNPFSRHAMPPSRLACVPGKRTSGSDSASESFHHLTEPDAWRKTTGGRLVLTLSWRRAAEPFVPLGPPRTIATSPARRLSAVKSRCTIGIVGVESRLITSSRPSTTCALSSAIASRDGACRGASDGGKMRR